MVLFAHKKKNLTQFISTFSYKICYMLNCLRYEYEFPRTHTRHRIIQNRRIQAVIQGGGVSEVSPPPTSLEPGKCFLTLKTNNFSFILNQTKIACAAIFVSYIANFIMKR